MILFNQCIFSVTISIVIYEKTYVRLDWCPWINAIAISFGFLMRKEFAKISIIISVKHIYFLQNTFAKY